LDGQLCNLNLSIEGKGFEHDFVCKAADKLRPKGPGELAENGLFEVNKRQRDFLKPVFLFLAPRNHTFRMNRPWEGSGEG
jgi:hypothetical protein